MGAYKEDVSGKRGHLVICQLGTSELSIKKRRATQHNYVLKILIFDAFDTNQSPYSCKMVLELTLTPSIWYSVFTKNAEVMTFLQLSSL